MQLSMPHALGMSRFAKGGPGTCLRIANSGGLMRALQRLFRDNGEQMLGRREGQASSLTVTVTSLRHVVKDANSGLGRALLTLPASGAVGQHNAREQGLTSTCVCAYMHSSLKPSNCKSLSMWGVSDSVRLCA